VIQPLLTVPAGHKYEILCANLHGNPGAEIIRGFLVTPAGGAIMWMHSETPPKEWSCQWVPGSFCLTTGDVLFGFSQLNVSVALTTYMDVTL
jgi:hypothetical protein